MEPLASSRSSTFSMSNWAYFASRTPSAMFSKSQKTARLRASDGLGIFSKRGAASLAPVLEQRVGGRHHHQGEQGRGDHAADHGDGERRVGLGARAQADGGGRQREDQRERGH